MYCWLQPYITKYQITRTYLIVEMASHAAAQTCVKIMEIIRGVQYFGKVKPLRGVFSWDLNTKYLGCSTAIKKAKFWWLPISAGCCYSTYNSISPKLIY